MCQNKIFIEYIYFVSVEFWEDFEVLLCCTCWGHFTFSLEWRWWKFEASQFRKKKSLNLNWNWTQAFTVAGSPGTNTQSLKSSRCGLLSLPDLVLICVGWYETVLKTDGCNLSKDAQGGLWFSWCPQRRQSPGTDFFASLFLAIRVWEEYETVEDGDSLTMACIPRTLEWFCGWLWHYWLWPLWPLRRKGNVSFPSLQGVCMVAKKLKKIQELAEVQQTSLQSPQLVLLSQKFAPRQGASWCADMGSSRYSYWVYLRGSEKLMTAHQEAGKAPSQTPNVHVSTSREGTGSSELGFMCNSSVRYLELQLLPSSGAASQGSLSPHSMAFPWASVKRGSHEAS